jgi:hypothetical protein
MSMSERLSNVELQEIDAYLASGATSSDTRVNGWLRSLADEVRESRGAAAGVEDSPQKRHGDALQDGSGTRHGEHELR